MSETPTISGQKPGPANNSGALNSIRNSYHTLFVESWSPYAGAVALVLLCALLMYDGLFWGVFGGLKLWGDHLNTWLGLAPLLDIPEKLESPLLHRISLMNMVLLLGAFSAALISRQFHINRPPPLEYVWGATGGILMGLGASLAGGCTVGGFFTPIMFSSPAGWTMWSGLLVGAVIGLKLLTWILEHISWGMKAPTPGARSSLSAMFPVAGIALICAVLYWALSWYFAEDDKLENRALLLVTVFAIGFILHRSRLCFSRAFREPFMTAEAEMPRAMILMLVIGVPLGSLLLQRQSVDPYLAIPATFWLGSLLGGVVFGVGMILAGGCASGSMWRAAEGHLKLIVALFFFAWSGSLFCGILEKLELSVGEYDIDFLDGIPEITPLGFQAYLPDLVDGWAWTYLISFAILAIWYLFVQYNERTERFTVV